MKRKRIPELAWFDSLQVIETYFERHDKNWSRKKKIELILNDMDKSDEDPDPLELLYKEHGQ
jgi:predicted GIY-YIG superfamily endonuclease